jgi:chitinase
LITRRKQAETIAQQSGQPVRRLSLLRMSCAILLLIGVAAGSVYAVRQSRAARSVDAAPTVDYESWFAAYVGATATPQFAFEQLGAASQRNVILSFVVASPPNACTPTWGAAYTLEQASRSLDLERRIAWLQQQGGHVAVSFGGRDNHELAIGCTDPAQLERAYKSVIDRYDLDTIDLDLESSNLTDLVVAARRATALAELQAEQRAQASS